MIYFNLGQNSLEDLIKELVIKKLGETFQVKLKYMELKISFHLKLISSGKYFK